MARSELALHRVRLAYERAHLVSAARAIVLAAALVALAIGLHRVTQLTWLVAALLTATLATFGWRGGAWRRGGLAGVIAGLPVFVAPALYMMTTHAGHCVDCAMRPTLPCTLLCFGTSSLVGVLVGRLAARDDSPSRFAAAALAVALLTGLLGCATMGIGGAIGVVIGLCAGGVTGWVVAAA